MVYALEAGIIPHSVELVHAVPAELNRRLYMNELDVAFVSTFEYLRHRENYDLLSNLCIAAYEHVYSVCLYSRCRLRDLDGKTIGITRQSASSVALLKLLCKRHWKIQVQFKWIDTEEEGFSLDACLLIGDQSLVHQEVDGFYRIDLANAWTYATGLPFTFAVFAIRKPLHKEKQDELEDLAHSFHQSLEWARNHKDVIIEKAIAKTNVSQSLLTKYYQTLLYTMGAQEREAIELFSELSDFEEPPITESRHVCTHI